MKQFLNKTTEILLFSFFVILPFSYNTITNKWLVFFILMTIFFGYIQFFQKHTQFKIQNFKVIYAVLMVMIFVFTERINFIRQFDIPVEISHRIPLSTLLLGATMLFFFVKILKEEKLRLNRHPFVRYFLFACVFLLVIMILFYPFLWHSYHMRLSSDVHLLNSMLKYMMIILLVTDYISDERKMKRINTGVIFSLGITVVISIIL